MDTIVTDAMLASSMTDAEANFEFSLIHDPDFTSTVLSSQLDSSNVLVVTLAKKIPPSSFRPVCVPPKDYINKMVKSKSCKEGREQKITQVMFFIALCSLFDLMVFSRSLLWEAHSRRLSTASLTNTAAVFLFSIQETAQKASLSYIPPTTACEGIQNTSKGNTTRSV